MSLFGQMKSLVSKSEGYRVVIEEKKMEFDALHESLRNLRCSTSDQLCFSKEELDHLVMTTIRSFCYIANFLFIFVSDCRSVLVWWMQIYIAHYQIEHGSIGFEEEDWVLKETEKADGIVLSEDSLAEKEASINRVKVNSNQSF